VPDGRLTTTGLVISHPKLIGIYSGLSYYGQYPDGNKIAIL